MGDSFKSIIVLAQDPSIQLDGVPLTARLSIPNDYVASGPRNSRLEVIDYDASADRFYGQHTLPKELCPSCENRERTISADRWLSDPAFHAANVYGIVASTLLEFEKALGRHLSWGFGPDSHQLKIFPHAFQEANAYYSKYDHALAFGYFPAPRQRNRTVYTCLSHDVVVHEATHALLDGLRTELTRPSSHDQAAFHEGFADIVALLKVLANADLIGFALRQWNSKAARNGWIEVDDVFRAMQERSVLTGLAEEMGPTLRGMGRDALRTTLTDLPPSPKYYHSDDYQAPHIRGEILVAAVLRAFFGVWETRVKGKHRTLSGIRSSQKIAVWRVEEEGARAAQHLLRMVIRAIDYLPPVHVRFPDFLTAVLTADWEICPDDSEYNYRDALVAAFKEYGIEPVKSGGTPIEGMWSAGSEATQLQYEGANIDSMRWNPDGMFRFLWRNYEPLGLRRDVFTRVNSVRPVWRVGPDGFVLRETVSEYYQLVKRATKADLRGLKIEPPPTMGDSETIDVVAGGTLVFDEFGRLKFHIHNRINSPKSQSDVLRHLHARQQSFSGEGEPQRPFADLHRRRASHAMDAASVEE